MQTKTRLRTNIIFQTAYQLLQVIVPLVVTPYISRVLGAENIGIQSYTYSIAYYFYMFAMLGVTNYGNRAIASVSDSYEDTSRTFWEIYTFQGFCGLIMSLVYLIYVYFFVGSNEIIAYIQVLYVLTAAVDVSWMFFGKENVKPVVIKNSIIKLVSLIGIFSLVRSKSDLWIYAILLTGGQLLGSLSMWFSVPSNVAYVKPTWKGIRRHIIPNIILFIPVIAISLYKIMDKIMLGSMSTKTQVGFYTNAESLVNVPIGFVTAVGLVMLPRMTNMIANGEEKEGIILFRKSINFTMLFSVAAAFGMASISDILVPIYYGTGYKECIPLIKGQSLVVLFLSWANVVRTQYLLPNNRDKQYIISVFGGAVINLILNAIFIPKYDAVGALIGTIFAEFTVCFIQSIDAARELPMMKCLIETIPYFVCGIVMYFLVHFLGERFGESIRTLLLQISVGGIIYILGCGLIVFIYKQNTKGIFYS